MRKKKSKAPSRPTEGLVVTHEGSGNSSRVLALLMLPVVMAACALAYRFYTEVDELKNQLSDVPRLEQREVELKAALNTERQRGDDLENDLVKKNKKIHALESALSESKEALGNQPKPTFDLSLNPGEIGLAEFRIERKADSEHSFSMTLRVSRMSDAIELPDVGRRKLGHLTVQEGERKKGNVRVVVVPKDEENGKRVYLPQKSWRRSEGFQYELGVGDSAEFSGEVELPADFGPGSARVEIFVDEPRGGYTLLRRVVPWTKS